MNLSELIRLYGDDKVAVQKLDDSAISLNMSNGVTKITFLTEEPLDIGGTDRLGLIVWMERGSVQAIIDDAKSAPIPQANVEPEPIVCDVLTMQHSSGFPDHFTRVRVGRRELTLFMSKIKGRCEYHAAELNWLLNGAEKPHILDFSDEEPEGLSEYLRSIEAETPSPQTREVVR